MIVSIYETDGCEYAILPEEDFLSCSRKIDITEKFWERYQAYVAEQEFIQSKLHRYYTDCKKQELINKTKDGKQPIGF